MLHTERLRLRAPQPGDEQAAFDGWARDPEVLRYLGWRPHGALADTRAQLDWDQARWLKRSAWTWLITQPAPGRADPEGALTRGVPIGMVQLTPLRFDGPAHHLRLGYLLARSRWGRGLMREAVSAVLTEAFEQAAVWRVDALCDVGNEASVRLLSALGFENEGVLRRHSLHPNVSDEPRDVTVHARLRAGGP
ncbi:MAG: GNAT family N-acetyltransferase [Burkholderiaceae bacterium]|nr:GNAT family N-acetyltransferase [Burkholderiaceae bacterium]